MKSPDVNAGQLGPSTAMDSEELSPEKNPAAPRAAHDNAESGIGGHQCQGLVDARAPDGGAGAPLMQGSHAVATISRHSSDTSTLTEWTSDSSESTTAEVPFETNRDMLGSDDPRRTAPRGHPDRPADPHSPRGDPLSGSEDSASEMGSEGHAGVCQNGEPTVAQVPADGAQGNARGQVSSSPRGGDMNRKPRPEPEIDALEDQRGSRSRSRSPPRTIPWKGYGQRPPYENSPTTRTAHRQTVFETKYQRRQELLKRRNPDVPVPRGIL